MLEGVHIPVEVPVMTLRDTVFFPRVVLPLYIFEERYRQMLSEVLAGERIFAVVREDPADATKSDDEPLSAVGTVGLVRAATKNDDGTSNVVLQGLARVRVTGIIDEEPYRRIAVEVIEDEAGAAEDELLALRAMAISTLKREPDLMRSLPKEFAEFLPTIEAPEIFVDVVASALVNEADARQRILEAPTTRSRLEGLTDFLEASAERFRFFRTLQGDVTEQDIGRN